ncbi:MAG: hypothetical protein IT190_10475 [Microbacteriaceae bacterium]|nr:hypothetical protein [Microbacteriaceae bacterium]
MKTAANKINIGDILGKEFAEYELIHSFYGETFALEDQFFPPVVSYALPRILQCESAGVFACSSPDEHAEQMLHYWFGSKDSAYISSGSIRVTSHCNSCPDSCTGICPVLMREDPQYFLPPYHVRGYPFSGSIRGHIVLSDPKSLRIHPEGERLIIRTAKRLFNQFKMQFHVDLGADHQAVDSLVPICSFCKKIRDDEYQWVRLEKFFNDKYSIQFTHSICPHCSHEYIKTIK